MDPVKLKVKVHRISSLKHVKGLGLTKGQPQAVFQPQHSELPPFWPTSKLEKFFLTEFAAKVANLGPFMSKKTDILCFLE